MDHLKAQIDSLNEERQSLVTENQKLQKQDLKNKHRLENKFLRVKKVQKIKLELKKSKKTIAGLSTHNKYLQKKIKSLSQPNKEAS